MSLMSIKVRLTEDMKQAMRDREAGKFRLSVIRMVLSSIKNVEINERRELSEDDVLGILSKEVKMRRDSYEEFKKAGRNDLAEPALAEIEILTAYLPEQLTAEQLREIIQEAITSTGASTQKEMGKVMAAIMPKTKGRADGKLVNQIVRELLS